MSSEKLEKEIEVARQQIQTDGYPMSIGEVISLYESNEVDIHPEFQRFYRWSDEQKSKLIESILLGIPIPTLFVSQQKNGTWDVIDGLQRLSTIFQLVGILRDHENKPVKPLILTGTKYLPSLEGKKWSATPRKKDGLSDTQRLLIRRAKLDIKIIKRESNKNTKYELFQRLNSGGTSLTRQELRNCLLVMINSNFLGWLQKVAKHKSFVDTTALSENLLEEQYDIELLIRFIVFRRIKAENFKTLRDIGDFLDDEIERIATDKAFSKEAEEAIIMSTFDTIAEGFENEPHRAFKRYDFSKEKFMGGFLISAFESIAIGLGSNIHKATTTGKAKLSKNMQTNVKKVWKDPAFKSKSGSGNSASSRIPITVDIGRTYFK